MHDNNVSIQRKTVWKNGIHLIRIPSKIYLLLYILLLLLLLKFNSCCCYYCCSFAHETTTTTTAIIIRSTGHYRRIRMLWNVIFVTFSHIQLRLVINIPLQYLEIN